MNESRLDFLRLELPMPSKLLSPNARVHWAAKAKAVKTARAKAKAAMIACLARAGISPPKWERTHYKVTFWCKTAARRDNDNLMASLKAYRDGIADAGLVADDCGMWPQGCEIKKDAADPRVVIDLWEVLS